MTAYVDADELTELVSLERGEIDRRIFSDEEIFAQEMDLIFGRAWQFLCHETQVPKPGDFFETPIGRDNVLTVRQRDRSIKAMLNTCTHRGNAVCRAEEGNTKAFMCTYHGWSFDLGGNLIGVPDADLFYKGAIDKAKYGLRQVAQLANYHGFVFATMDPTAPPLEEYLGATGRLAIDLMAARDVEAVPGVQKFVIDCNWKFAADNPYDWYHPQITHMSALRLGLFPTSPDVVTESGGAQSTLGEELTLTVSVVDGRDEIVVLGEYGHGIAGPSARNSRLIGDPADHAWRERPEVVEALGPVGVEVAGHPNIFPNSWLTNFQLSLRIPISPTKTEIWWFSFVEKDASPEARAATITRSNRVFGPAGFLEQDDGENWAQATLQTHGPASQRIPQLLKMGLNRGNVIKKHGLNYIETTTSEHAQLWLYHSWAQWMKGLDWDALRKATAVPDTM